MIDTFVPDIAVTSNAPVNNGAQPIVDIEPHPLAANQEAIIPIRNQVRPDEKRSRQWIAR